MILDQSLVTNWGIILINANHTLSIYLLPRLLLLLLFRSCRLRLPRKISLLGTHNIRRRLLALTRM
jgi:hypothetical protein